MTVAGRLMHDKVGTLSLEAGAYEILTVASYFGPLNSDVSFLKLRVDESQEGSICGFYLYGKLENGLPTTLQLSGGNLGGADILVSDIMPSGTQLVKIGGRQRGALGFPDPAAF